MKQKHTMVSECARDIVPGGHAVHTASFGKCMRCIFLALLMVGTVLDTATAQYYFDFGSSSLVPRDECPVLVFTPIDQASYTVTISVAGFVFDDALEYSRQLSEETYTAAYVTGQSGYTGIFHVNQFGNNPSTPMGDVDTDIPELLGCGKYKIHFEQGADQFDIFLDLTDAKWATATSFRNILFDAPDFGTPNVRIFISVDSPMSPDLIDCGYYGPNEQQGEEAKYWYLVRNHGTAHNYARDLDGFNIDPSYTGPDPSGDQNTDEIPYGIIAQATSDVYLTIEDDIVIPDGKEWIITTDPDGINNPYYEQTFVSFNSGKGLTIEDGGKLTTVNSGAFGVVDFFPSSSTVGDWPGIMAESGSEVSL